MEGIEPLCAGVVDELSVERIADGIVLDLWLPLVLVVEGGGVELGVGLVDPLSVGLLDGLVPVLVLVNGRVELCTSAVDELFAGLVPKGGAGPCVNGVEGLFVGLVDIDFPLLVPIIMLGVGLRTDGDNVLFDEGLINEVANNTSEFEFSQHAYRSFCGTNSENEIYNSLVSMYLRKLPLILPETAIDGWVLALARVGWGTNFGSWIVRRLTRAP